MNSFILKSRCRYRTKKIMIIMGRVCFILLLFIFLWEGIIKGGENLSHCKVVRRQFGG